VTRAHRAWRALLVPALALGLAACALGPRYERPEPPLPADWRDPTGEGAAWPSPGWWREFGSPALERYMAIAADGNIDIAVAAARILQADAQLRIAGASLLPTASGSADASRSRPASSSNRTAQFSTNIGTSFGASYEVDFWGRNRAAVQSADARALASRFDRETVTLSVAANVATTYFQILEFQDRLAIARDNLDNALRVLAVVEARAQQGAVSALDLAQQRTVILNQRAAIPALELQVQQGEIALSSLLGITPDQVRAERESLDRVSTPSPAPGLPSLLLARRPDIRNAEAILVASNADLRAARAALFPSLELTAQTGFESAMLSALLRAPSMFMSIAAGITQPIFEGGRLSGEVDRSRARYEELAQEYRRAILTALSDVETALVATRQTAEQQALQDAASEQARIAFVLADLRYREGAVDLVTVLDAQRTLFQARDNLVQVKSSRLQAIVGLFRALGGGWEAREDGAVER
jgi:NodT family efflux transporter outer membrane factor (OMF) lipoprotein